MRGSEWLDHGDNANGRSYTIRQNKYAPLKIWLLVLGGMIACMVLAVALASLGLAGLGFIPGVIGIFFGFAALRGIFIIVPATLARRKETSFSIDSAGIALREKLKKEYPDRIAFGEISHIHYGLSVEPSTDKSVAKTAWGVWLNVRGRDVYLANALTEPQALFLYGDLATKLGFQTQQAV